jgi:hypothetical protein
MFLDVSIGEALDKYSILELKLNYIQDILKKKEVENELEKLSMLKNYKDQYNLYYKSLYFINKKIWEFTDIIKSMKISDENFSKISYDIFEYNQYRFRIKNIINITTNSNIKEQKSYSSNNVYVYVGDIDKYLEKIYCLTILYDTVYIYSENHIKKLPVSCIQTNTKTEIYQDINNIIFNDNFIELIFIISVNG